MMGVGHALLGTATWAVTATTVLPWVGIEPIPAVLILGTFPVAGAALRPDIDHPSATMANSGGFITKTIAQVANGLSGGHREGTHRLWFLFACLAFDAAVLSLGGVYGALVLFGLYTAFGAQALAKTPLYARMNRKWKKHTGLFAKLWCWAVALVVTGAAYLIFPGGDIRQWWWLAVALFLGHASHLLGDALTTDGWEWAQGHKLRLPILGDAGSSREVLFSSALGVVAVVFMVASLTNTDILGLVSDMRGSIASTGPVVFDQMSASLPGGSALGVSR